MRTAKSVLLRGIVFVNCPRKVERFTTLRVLCRVSRMDTTDLPWERYFAQSVIIFVAVLAFQYLTRGTTTIPIALVVAIGFFAMSIAVDRHQRET